MNRTKIQYLDFTWNPIAMLCSPVSAGCDHCWHRKMAKRLAGNQSFRRDEVAAWNGSGPPTMRASELEAPRRVKTPSRIGVQFMGDLFHPDVDSVDRSMIFDEMCACKDHTFLLLTKRPEEALPWLKKTDWGEPPLPNVWFGVSVEDQESAEKRIPYLLDIPAAMRWVSAEPLLAPLELRQSHRDYLEGWDTEPAHAAACRGECRECPVPRQVQTNPIDWVVAGCESGPGRRPCEVIWLRNLRDQCLAAGVPFFLKQMEIDGKIVEMPWLDGEVWDQVPTACGQELS